MLEKFLLGQLPPFLVQSLIQYSKHSVEFNFPKLSDMRAIKDERLVFKVNFSSKVIVNKGEVKRLPNFYYDHYFCTKTKIPN